MYTKINSFQQDWDLSNWHNTLVNVVNQVYFFETWDKTFFEMWCKQSFKTDTI